MANIKISELNSINQLDAQELNQVVGGGYGKKDYYWWKKYVPTYVSYSDDDIVTQTASNTSTNVVLGSYKTTINTNQGITQIANT